MAYYDVTATFEVKADSPQAAEQYAKSNLNHISTGEYQIEMIELAKDQGDGNDDPG